MTRSDGSEDERGAVPTFVTGMISGSRWEHRATLLPARPQQQQRADCADRQDIATTTDRRFG